jgi:hypothetical protein
VELTNTADPEPEGAGPRWLPPHADALVVGVAQALLGAVGRVAHRVGELHQVEQAKDWGKRWNVYGWLVFELIIVDLNNVEQGENWNKVKSLFI